MISRRISFTLLKTVRAIKDCKAKREKNGALITNCTKYLQRTEAYTVILETTERPSQKANISINNIIEQQLLLLLLLYLARE